MFPTWSRVPDARMWNRRRIASVVSVLLVTPLLTSCGSKVEPTSISTQQPVTVTVTTTSTVTETVTVSPTEAVAEPLVEPTPDGDPTTATTKPVTPEPGQLKLADFFSPEGWEENRYDVADKKQVLGIRTDLGPGCGSNNDGSQELELRLGASYSTLKFVVGQTRDSISSQRVMTVRVFADNDQVEIKKVAFNKVQPFTVDVARASAVRIRFTLDMRGDECRDPVIKPVLFGAVLE